MHSLSDHPADPQARPATQPLSRVIVSVLLLHKTKYIFTNAEFSFNSNDIEEDGFILADAMTGTFVELL